MVAYKDILEAFGGNTSYADRFQSAALKGDTEGMSNIRNEYNVSIGKNKETPKTKTDTDNNNNYTPVPTQTYTPEGYTPQQQNQNHLGNWNYGSDTAERQEEIVRNLNEAYAQDPSRFSDWATFANNFNYDYGGRSDKERETMRNWYDTQIGPSMDYNDLNNTDYFFNQLMNGGTLNGTGAAIENARTRYSNWQYLSGLQPSVIASSITDGKLNGVGQEMQDLKNFSPALYAQVQAILQGKTQLDDINAVGEGIYKGLTDTETNGNYTNYNMTTGEYVKNASIIKQYNESLYKKIESLGLDTAAYVEIVATMLQNPAIQASKNEVVEIEGEINKIQEQIYNIGETVRAKLGSEAPEDLVSAYISNQTKQLQNQLRTAQNSLLVAQGKLSNQVSEVESMIDALNYGIDKYAEGAGGNNYQFVSGTKYQEAGYFDKSTGEFHTLDEVPDTNDYQTSDPARLQEIEDNLNNIANSDDAYVFRDRQAFNDYFKYNKRGAAQKKVLDDFWEANSERLQPIAQKAYQNMIKNQNRKGNGNDNNVPKTVIDKIKKDLLDGIIVSFGESDMKKKYGIVGGADAEHNIITQIGEGATKDEIEILLRRLNDANDVVLLDGYWSVHEDKVISKIKSMYGGKLSRKNKQSIADYLTSLETNKDRLKGFLEEAGLSTNEISELLP